MMNRPIVWVVPNKISVDIVLALPDKELKQIVELASNIVVMHINRFIDANRNSSDENLRDAALRLADAAEYTNKKAQYLSSDETRDLVEELRNLTAEDVTINVPKEKLLTYKMLIDEILTNDFAVAYTDEKDTENLRNNLAALIDAGGFYESMNEKEAANAIFTMVRVIDDNKGLFRNPPFKKNASTILRGVLYRKEEFELIGSGIDYLLGKMQSGAHPRSWRIC